MSASFRLIFFHKHIFMYSKNTNRFKRIIRAIVLTVYCLSITMARIHAQDKPITVSVIRKPDAYPIYLKAAKRYNDQYLNPTGYIIQVKAHESLKITQMMEKIALFERQNKPSQALEQQLERLIQKEGLKSTTFSFQGLSYNFMATETATCIVPKKGLFKIKGEAKYNNGQVKKLDITIKILDFLIVAMGDSYISGEGNPDKPADNSTTENLICELTSAKMVLRNSSSNNPQQWQESNAHRSLNNGASFACQQIDGKMDTTFTLIRFASFARSGAKIRKGLIEPNTDDQRDNWIQLGQIDEAINNIRGTKIDALILSISGNDVEFADGLTYLATGDHPVLKNAKNDTERKRLESRFNQKLALVSGNFDLLYQKLKQLNIRKTLITEYPVGLFETTQNGMVINGTPCGVFSNLVNQVNLEKEDGILFKKLGNLLNSTIDTAAQKYGWIYVGGIQKAFAGHGYCSPSSYYVGAEESCKTQDDFMGIAHPNIKGHQVIGEEIYKELKVIIDQFGTSTDSFVPNVPNGN